MNFDQVWDNIVKHEGQTFFTITNLPFTYQIDQNRLITNRTDYPLSKANFKKAFELLPVQRPGAFSRDIRGSSYVYAIFHDRRIRQ